METFVKNKLNNNSKCFVLGKKSDHNLLIMVFLYKSNIIK